MFTKIKNRLFSTKKAVNDHSSHHQNLNLELAFVSGGVSFYKYRDDFSIPAERALSAMDFYEELNQRIDREYLVSFFETIEYLLNTGKLVDAANIVKMAKSRLDHITNANILMKLATVIYIAEWENPEQFNMVDAEKKIMFWQKNEDVSAFFLRQPIASLIPFTESSNPSTQNYLVLQNKENERQLMHHLNLLSGVHANIDLMSSLKLQLERTQQLTKFLEQE